MEKLHLLPRLRQSVSLRCPRSDGSQDTHGDDTIWNGMFRGSISGSTAIIPLIKSAPIKADGESPISGLPPELQVMILRETLFEAEWQEDGPINLAEARLCLRRQPDKANPACFERVLQPALTDKFFRYEMRSLFFGTQTFAFSPASRAKDLGIAHGTRQERERDERRIKMWNVYYEPGSFGTVADEYAMAIEFLPPAFTPLLRHVQITLSQAHTSIDHFAFLARSMKAKGFSLLHTLTIKGRAKIDDEEDLLLYVDLDEEGHRQSVEEMDFNAHSLRFEISVSEENGTSIRKREAHRCCFHGRKVRECKKCDWEDGFWQWEEGTIDMGTL